MKPKFISLANRIGCLAACILAALSPGCVVGPDYHRPPVPVPPAWGWKLAEPSERAIKGDWWKPFHDPMLDGLEAEAVMTNPSLQIAVARVDQSRAIARITASRFFPQLSFDPSVASFHTQLNHVPSDLTATAYTMPLDLSYEIDLWGKIRRAFESAHDQAQATRADYDNVLLTLNGDVAINYFLLRQIDSQIDLLKQTVQLRERSVRIITERFQGGLAPELDVERSQTDRSQTETLLIEAQRQRDDLQNALALLCGQPASSFNIPPAVLDESLPLIPIGLPSSLLERRPDIAAAERRMAAANAQIGVARAAFFPAISLTGDAGYSSFHASTLLDWESQLFQIGPGVTFPLLNGGRLKAAAREAQAVYQESCAAYHQQVLAAFRDVSDSLVDLDSYGRQANSQADALASANRAANSALERYRQGLTNYLDVLDAQRTQLQIQSQTIQLRASQLIATVHLIKSLGGGFNEGSLSKS
jgi:multidrug efflux system outer membrane protein